MLDPSRAPIRGKKGDGMAGNTDFGSDLRTARQEAGLTQVRLALELGVDPGAVSGWERGIRMPDGQNRAVVARFMGLTIADFLVKYEAGENGSTSRRSRPTAPTGETAGARARRVKAEAEAGQQLSAEELATLRGLLRRLEGTG